MATHAPRKAGALQCPGSGTILPRMSQEIASIPELAAPAGASGIVRLPDGLDVPFTPRVRALVDTPDFQRLRHVPQLGLAAVVYPGAVHTRFEHSLGVFGRAVRVVRQLADVPRFGELISAGDAGAFLAAALLHDLGHWPFCHPVEDLGLPGVPPHEELTVRRLSSGPVADVLRDHWDLEPSAVGDLLTGTGGPPGTRLLRRLLGGPIDVDKLDYLGRDSLHAGVPYGRNFDENRLIASLTVNEAGDGPALTAKGRTAAELMVFARYVMFSEVYWHQTVRAATAMLGAAVLWVWDRLGDERDALFVASEGEFIRRLTAAAAGTDAASLVDGLFGPTRTLHKRVDEFSLYQRPDLYRRLAGRPAAELAAVADRLRERLSPELGPLPPHDLLLDAPPKTREVEFDVDILFPRERVSRKLSTVSPVTETLAKRQFDDCVKRVRVFCHPRLRDTLRERGGVAEVLGEVL